MTKKPANKAGKGDSTRGVPKKAMDFAAEFDWPGYFNAVEGKPARETLVKALDLFEREGGKKKRELTALDLGCGEGRDTRELLRRKGPGKGKPIRWSLMVTDGSAKGLEILLDSLSGTEHPRVCAAQCKMEELPRRYPNGVRVGIKERNAARVDLVNASFVLPFCSAKELPRLWAWITRLIRPDGRFSGQFFGDRDTWAHVRKTTGITRARLERMFRDFVFEELREEEKDDVTSMGEPKHWHVYHIVARKRG